MGSLISTILLFFYSKKQNFYKTFKKPYIFISSTIPSTNEELKKEFINMSNPDEPEPVFYFDYK